MRTARRTFVATGTVAILAAAGVTAAIAADPAPPPPPKIAFLANGINPADALAAGPIAGQLGAPIYTTQPSSLSPAAASGLGDYDPELVIVLGGPVAITDDVVDQVETATGLTETDTATPAGGIVRAAGGDRFDTAAAVADLLSAYNPAYLPINMQAIDADTLDGKQASEFALKSDLGSGGDADTLDGKDSTHFQAAGDYLPPGTVTTHNGGGGWLPHRSSPTTVDRYISSTRVSGDGVMILPLTSPTRFADAQYGLAEIRICYESDAGGHIERIAVWRSVEGSIGERVLYDTTDRASNTNTCDSFDVDASVGTGMGVYVYVAGGGTVRLSGVETTWSRSASTAG